MLKGLLIFTSLFIGTVSWASDQSCYDKLLNGGDSNAIKVWADLGDDMEKEDQVKTLIARAIEKVGCDQGEVIATNISCKNIDPDHSWAEVCYAEADIGYFFVMKDMVDTANVVFNRWD
ncbi:MAG: hypothetical protein R3B45_11415 [Bdellovibrionota bacterium]